MEAAGLRPPRARWKLTRGGARLSIEAEPRERGAFSPRARRSPARGGVRPPSVADLYQGGAVPLEWSGVPPEGGWADYLTGRGSVGLFCVCV
jgi:hypothetical protein